MIQKLKNSKGITLIETLCVVVIFIFLSLILGTGINLAFNSYKNITAQSEIHILAATISDLLADDLRCARDVKLNADNTVKSYNSDSYGNAADININDDGQIEIGGKKIVPSGAYGNGAYKTKELIITYDNTFFTIDLALNGQNDNITCKTNFTVRCLNSENAI